MTRRERFYNLCDDFIESIYWTTKPLKKQYVSYDDEDKYFSDVENVKRILKTLHCTLNEFKEVVTFLSKKFTNIRPNIFRRIKIISTVIDEI